MPWSEKTNLGLPLWVRRFEGVTNKNLVGLNQVPCVAEACFSLILHGSMGSSLNANWEVSNNSSRGMLFCVFFPAHVTKNQAWLNIDKYWWTLRSWYFQTTCELQSLPSIHLITSHRCQATHGHGHHSLSNVARALPWQGGQDHVLKGSPSDRL